MAKTIYLFRDRDRFKVGRSKSFSRRITAYRHMIPDGEFLLEIEFPDSTVIEEVEARVLAAIVTAGFKKLKAANREWFVGDADKAVAILRQLLLPVSNTKKLDIEPFCRPLPRFPVELDRQLNALFARHNSRGNVQAMTRAQQKQHDSEYSVLIEEIRAFSRRSLSTLSNELGLGSLLEPDAEFRSYIVKKVGACFRRVSSPVDAGSDQLLDLEKIINGAGGGNIYDHRYRFYVGPIPYAVAAASYVSTKTGFEALPAIEKSLAAVGWRALQIPDWHYYVTTRDLGMWLFVRDESPDELLASWRSSFVKWAEDNTLSLMSRRREWAGDYYEDAERILLVLEDIKHDPFIPVEARSWSYVRSKSKPYAEVSPDDDLFGIDGFSTRPLIARLFVWWEELGCPAGDSGHRPNAGRQAPKREK